ncbi:hypothetical protein INR49_008991, partial [Caranx melampygus]
YYTVFNEREISEHQVDFSERFDESVEQSLSPEGRRKWAKEGEKEKEEEKEKEKEEEREEEKEEEKEKDVDNKREVVVVVSNGQILLISFRNNDCRESKMSSIK